MKEETHLPRVIHYCWFGGNPLPESAVKCIESWKKYCPDFEIREWNESNYNVNACAYTREAYQAKKWAFVSDYARFDILYTYGGVYFDTDVELIRPIDDILLRGPFLAQEQRIGEENRIVVAPGLGMAADAGHPVYREMLSQYSRKHFVKPDGTYEQTTIVKYMTDLLLEYGLMDTQEIQIVQGIWIYPWDYFCPLRYRTEQLTITENTRSIHYYNATWFTREEQKNLQFTIKASKLFGEKAGRRLGGLHSLPYRVRMKVKQKGFWGAVRFAIEKIL